MINDAAQIIVGSDIIFRKEIFILDIIYQIKTVKGKFNFGIQLFPALSYLLKPFELNSQNWRRSRDWERFIMFYLETTFVTHLFLQKFLSFMEALQAFI